MRILNLHGFGGDGNNTNYMALRKLFPEAEIVSRTYDYMHTYCEDIIDDCCFEGGFDLVVGNSFGGFLAYIIGAELGIKTILTNPCIPAYEYIPRIIKGYGNGAELKELWANYAGKNHNCYVLLGTDDKVLDYTRTVAVLGATANIEYEEGAGHSISGEHYEVWLKRSIET